MRPASFKKFASGPVGPTVGPISRSDLGEIKDLDGPYLCTQFGRPSDHPNTFLQSPQV